MPSKVRHIVVALFQPERERDFAFLTGLWLVGLYLLGSILWGYFFNWRLVLLDYHDWINVNIPRLDVIRDALYRSQLPLHVKDISFLHDVDRFFSVPDVITTPQMILLRFVSIQSFVLFDVLFHFSLGFVGLLWFRQRFKLALLPFTLMFFLFNYNGYIILHYAAGHFTWAGYFLFPAFFALMLEFVDNVPGWLWITKISLLLFYIVLAGSEHHFLWLLMFLGVLSLVEIRKFFWGATAIIFSGLVSAIRLIPPALYTTQFSESITNNFLLSYNNILVILEMLIKYQDPGLDISKNVDPLYWEFALYIGPLAALFLLVFGVLSSLRYTVEPSLKRFVIPALFIFIMTIGNTFDLLRATRFPLFLGERVSTRMISVPLVFLIIFATVNFQMWLNAGPKRISVLFAFLAGFMVIVYDLINHLDLWQIKNARAAFGQYMIFRKITFDDLSKNSLNQYWDPPYVAALILGASITILSIGTLLFLSRRKTNSTLE